MENYEDYLKQVADLGGANSKKPLQDFYNVNGALIRFFGSINIQIDQWLKSSSLDDVSISHILNALNQHKTTLASLKSEAIQTDIADYEVNTRTKLEKQLAYINSEMVLEEAELVLQNLKKLKSTPRNDNNYLTTFLNKEYGEGYTYEGDLLNNYPHGSGKILFPNFEVFAEGEFIQGKLNGFGKQYLCWGGPKPEDKFNGRYLRFEGSFFNGELVEGIIYRPNLEKYLQGEFRDEKLNGNGKKYTIKNQIIEEGHYFNNELDGLGIKYWDGKIEEKGNYKNGKLFGFGEKFYFENGRLIESGYFKDGLLHGQGKKYAYYFDENSLDEEGTFLNGKLSGKGRKYLLGKIAYEGNFDNGILNGLGKHYVDGILTEEGVFLSGKLHGNGTRYLYNEFGILEFLQKGNFINGVFQGE